MSQPPQGAVAVADAPPPVSVRSLIRAVVEKILKDVEELLSIEYLPEVDHSAKEKKYYRKFIEPRIARITRIYSGFYACNLSHSWMCILQSPQAPKLRRWRWGLLIDTPGQAL